MYLAKPADKLGSARYSGQQFLLKAACSLGFHAFCCSNFYQREATRLLLWLQHERQRRLAQMDIEDCTAYMAFLQHVPERRISRERARPGQPGWAPFRGPLSHASYRQAVVIVNALFTWLQSAQYLPGNP